MVGWEPWATAATAATAAAALTRTLELDAQPGSKVALGYLGEAPLWRASYRLLLEANGSATLQGWALLHNDSNEDWRGLAVELVNGRPDSFLFPLAAPRYSERRLVTPERQLSSIWRLEHYARSGSLPKATRSVLASAARALDESYDEVFRLARLEAGLELLEQQSQRLQGTIRSVTAARGVRVESLMQRLVTTERRIEATQSEIRRIERVDRWARVREELARLPNAR
jgi:hypothetical protein